MFHKAKVRGSFKEGQDVVVKQENNVNHCIKKLHASTTTFMRRCQKEEEGADDNKLQKSVVVAALTPAEV